MTPWIPRIALTAIALGALLWFVSSEPAPAPSTTQRDEAEPSSQPSGVPEGSSRRDPPVAPHPAHDHSAHGHNAGSPAAPPSARRGMPATDAGVVAPSSPHHHVDHIPQRLVDLLGDPDGVEVGTLRVLELNTTQSLWVTRYELLTAAGATVEVLLPGGSDGEIVQQVGQVPTPENGSEVALTWDEDGRPVWSYHEDGTLTGGSLEGHTITW